MTTWNHRIIKKHDQGSDTSTYQIHEVYYSEKGDIEGWTENPVKPLGETEFELREDIRYFLQAFRQPTLEEKDIDGKPQLIEDDYNSPINPGHYFEFMDRTSVALDYMYQFLGSHPLLKKEGKLKNAYQKVEESLAELYQLAGQLDHEKGKK